MPPFKMIELFAGISGIRLGFDNAFGNDAETVFVSEIDPYAVRTYEYNFDTPFEISGDILQIDEKNIPAFDICLAGFPCQAFSIAGNFCENVKGLVIHDKGRTFKTIYTAFEKLGYNIHYKILNSKDFGLAQNRERIYIVCFRNDIDDSNFKFPTPANKKLLLQKFWKMRLFPQNIIWTVLQGL